MTPYNTARDRLAELALHARCGVYDKGLPIGHFSNARRFPELADLRSEEVRRWGEVKRQELKALLRQQHEALRPAVRTT